MFKRKLDDKNNIKEYKEELEVKGYAQIPGVNFNDKFAYVTIFTTIRTLSSIDASKNMEIRQMNVKGAYLNENLKKSIYIEILDSVKLPKNNENFNCLKLKKGLCGLR